MSDTITQSSDAHGAALIAALKAARAALGWSQMQLAAASGISKVTIARMESGMMSPRLSTLSALQAAMERSGVRMTLNDPTGGFSLRVEAKALGSNQAAIPQRASLHSAVDGIGDAILPPQEGRQRDRDERKKPRRVRFGIDL